MSVAKLEAISPTAEIDNHTPLLPSLSQSSFALCEIQITYTSANDSEI